MTFLSRVPVNPMRRRSQELLGNPQLIHAQILNALPNQPAQERTLWRREIVQDASRTGRRVDLLVLTQTPPSWAEVVGEFGWPDTDEGQGLVRDCAPILGDVALGRDYAFRVTANPTSITHSPQGRAAGVDMVPLTGRGVRVGHRTAPHQLDWFLARTVGAETPWGFSLGDPTAPMVRIVGREQLKFRKHKGGPLVTLDTATFEGVLRVSDVARFREVLLGGIGRGKAYGCGLLTIARPGVERVVAG